MPMPMPVQLHITLPIWVMELDIAGRDFSSDAAKVAFAIELSKHNIERQSGGPFGAAVFSAGILGFWPGPVARTHRRGLVLGGLLGFLAVIRTAVPNWFVFTTAPTLSQPLQFLSLVWGGTLDFVALVGSFLIAVSVIGLLTRGGSAPRDH